MLKLLISNILMLAVLANPLAAMAQTSGSAPVAPVAISAAEYQVAFDQITYSLENLEAVVKDLDQVRLMGREALTGRPGVNRTARDGSYVKNIPDLIHQRFSAAVSLMSAIMIDESIPERERAELTMKLSGRIGAILFTVLRHQGADLIEIDDSRAPRTVLVNSVETAQSVLREIFVIDMASLVTFKESADGRRVWAPADRIARDRLTRQLLTDLTPFTQGALQHFSQTEREGRGNRLDNAATKLWNEDIIQRAIDIRKSRSTAQFTTTAMYLGLALYGLVLPAWDMFGAFDGRSDNSLFVSSMVYFTSIMTLLFLPKLASLPSTVLAVLEDTRAYVNGETPSRNGDRMTIYERLGQAARQGYALIPVPPAMAARLGRFSPLSVRCESAFF